MSQSKHGGFKLLSVDFRRRSWLSKITISTMILDSTMPTPTGATAMISETGLYFLNSRFYTAGIGRFLTKDTFKGIDKNPQSLYRYAYSEGDPVNLTDPSGHAALAGDGIGEKPYSAYREATGKNYSLVQQSSDSVGADTLSQPSNSQSVANANMALVGGALAATVDKKLVSIAQKSASKVARGLSIVGNVSGIVGAGIALGLGFASDYYNYGDHWGSAMLLTTIGFVLTAGATGIAIALGAPIWVALGVSIIASGYIGQKVDQEKKRRFGQ